MLHLRGRPRPGVLLVLTGTVGSADVPVCDPMDGIGSSRSSLHCACHGLASFAHSHPRMLPTVMLQRPGCLPIVLGLGHCIAGRCSSPVALLRSALAVAHRTTPMSILALIVRRVTRSTVLARPFSTTRRRVAHAYRFRPPRLIGLSTSEPAARYGTGATAMVCFVQHSCCSR